MMTDGPGGDIYILDGSYVRVMDASNNVNTFYAGITQGVTVTAIAVDNRTNIYLAESLEG